VSDSSSDEYLQARRLADQFPPTLEDELRAARISQAREEEHERLCRFYTNFLTFRPRQLALTFPPETLFNLERDRRFEVWTDHPVLVRNLYELLEVKITSQTELEYFIDNTLPRFPGAAQTQLFYWHLAAVVTQNDEPVDRVYITEDSIKFWFELIPTQAAHIRNQLRTNRRVYYWTSFELTHHKIELRFNEIRLVTNPAANLTPFAPAHTFTVVDRKEFRYEWNLGIWETTLSNPDPNLIDPEESTPAPNPVATNRVFSEEELVENPGIGYRATANQVTQELSSTTIEEVSETDTIDVGELIELASAAERRTPSPETDSSLPPSSTAYTPTSEPYIPQWLTRTWQRPRERNLRPRSCNCEGREVCTCGYRPDTPPTPPHIQLWEPRDLVLPSQSWIYPE
jgi:hypothetical protein